MQKISLTASDIFCRLLIVFANSFFPDQVWGNISLIWFQKVWHSDGIPESFFRKKKFFEQLLADIKICPSMQCKELRFWIYFSAWNVIFYGMLCWSRFFFYNFKNSFFKTIIKHSWKMADNWTWILLVQDQYCNQRVDSLIQLSGIEHKLLHKKLCCMLLIVMFEPAQVCVLLWQLTCCLCMAFYIKYMHSGAVTKIDFINSNVHRSEHYNLVTSRWRKYKLWNRRFYNLWILNALHAFIVNTKFELF